MSAVSVDMSAEFELLAQNKRKDKDAATSDAHRTGRRLLHAFGWASLRGEYAIEIRKSIEGLEPDEVNEEQLQRELYVYE